MQWRHDVKTNAKVDSTCGVALPGGCLAASIAPWELRLHSGSSNCTLETWRLGFYPQIAPWELRLYIGLQIVPLEP